MLVKVMNTSVNSKKCVPPSPSQVQQFLESRRQIFEQSRSSNLKRIQQDIQRIAKRERDYSKKVIEELIPVKIVWDEDAWKKLQEFVPIRFETKEESENEVISPEVVVEDKSNTV